MKKILVCILCLLMVGCGAKESNNEIVEKRDIEEIKNSVSESEFQIFHSNYGITFNWKVSDETNEQINFDVYLSDDKKEVNKINYTYLLNKDVNETKIIYENGKVVDNSKIKKAIELLEKNNLHIIDLVDYSNYCIENEYYNDFKN